MLVTRTEDSPLCLLQRMVLSSQQPVTSSDIFGIGYTTMVRFVCMALTNNWLTMACFSTIIPEHYDYHVNIDGYYTNNNLFFSFIFYLFLLLPLLSVNTRSAKPPSTIADSASDLTRKCAQRRPDPQRWPLALWYIFCSVCFARYPAWNFLSREPSNQRSTVHAGIAACA